MMIRLTLTHIFRFLAGMLMRMRSYSRIHLKPIDMQDVFPAEMDELIAPEKTRNFRVFSSIEDYNREITYLFQTHNEAFYLDRSHNDGHFRV